MKKEIIYAYPLFQKGSFNKISQYHISHLRNYFKIHEMDCDQLVDLLNTLMWTSPKNIILHPLFYPILGSPERIKTNWSEILGNFFNVSKKLIGIDTTDSDRISKNAVIVANNFDLIIVPSTWAKESYKKSRVKTRIEVIPHGVSDIYFKCNVHIKNEKLKKILELKRKRKYIYILFFLLHSGYRKGADLVFKSMIKVQHKYKDVVLVVKRGDLVDPHMYNLRKLRCIEIAGWISEEDLVALYDMCDIVLCPSRGGGFELNALEALARGKPVIVPHDGCFLDYIDLCIPVRISKRPIVLVGNNVHVGRGHEVDLDDFTEKIMDTIEAAKSTSPDSRVVQENIFSKYQKIIKKKYSWKVVCEKLRRVLERVID